MNPSFYLVVLLSCGLTLVPGGLGDPDPDPDDTPLTEQQILDRNALWKLNIDQLLDEYFRLMERVRYLEELVERLSKPRVAFSVTDPTPTIAGDNDVTLRYKTVFTNIGSDYDTDTGIFLVGTPGLYYFTFFFHTMNRKFGPLTGLELRLNGDPKVKCIEQVAGGDYGDSAGNAIILDLVAGDKVTVVIKQEMCIKDEDYVNTFTGFLLQPHVPEYDSLD